MSFYAIAPQLGATRLDSPLVPILADAEEKAKSWEWQAAETDRILTDSVNSKITGDPIPATGDVQYPVQNIYYGAGGLPALLTDDEIRTLVSLDTFTGDIKSYIKDFDAQAKAVAAPDESSDVSYMHDRLTHVLQKVQGVLSRWKWPQFKAKAPGEGADGDSGDGDPLGIKKLVEAAKWVLGAIVAVQAIQLLRGK